MEPILAVLGGVISAAIVAVMVKTNADKLVAKFGPVIHKTFEVLDPIASDLIDAYDESLVQEALELIVYRVADAKLDEKDALAITKYVAEKFSLTRAAAAKLDPATETGKVSLEIAGMTKMLFDGAEKEELVELARKAVSLI